MQPTCRLQLQVQVQPPTALTSRLPSYLPTDTYLPIHLPSPPAGLRKTPLVRIHVTTSSLFHLTLARIPSLASMQAI